MENNIMTYDEALRTIEYYKKNAGYPTLKELLNNYATKGYNKYLTDNMKNWEAPYLSAILAMGQYNGPKEERQEDSCGAVRTSNWYNIATIFRKEIAHRKTVAGKKEFLRTIAPTAVRGADCDKLESMRNARVQVATVEGDSRKAKRQAKLNAERLEHIKALEKSLSVGGPIRDVCDSTLAEYNKRVDNLPTNEETAKAVMKERRKNRILSLLLSWLIMPIYVIVKAFDLLFDSSVAANMISGDLTSRFGGKFPMLGRLTIPFMLSGFFALVDVLGGNNKMEAGPQFVMNFLIYLVAFTIIKNILGIPFAYAAEGLGNIAEAASECFASYTEEDYQFADAAIAMRSYESYKEIFENRQDIIRSLREAIENNYKRGSLDDLRNYGSISLKALEKEQVEHEKQKRKGSLYE